MILKVNQKRHIQILILLEIESSSSPDSKKENQLGAENTVIGYIGTGVSVQEALYRDADLRKVCRLYTVGEANRTFPKTQLISPATFKEAEAYGAVIKASLTIQAVSENNVYPLFGKVHSTTLLISSSANLQEIAAFFFRRSFKTGPKDVAYKLVPDSMKIITSGRASTPLC